MDSARHQIPGQGWERISSSLSDNKYWEDEMKVKDLLKNRQARRKQHSHHSQGMQVNAPMPTPKQEDCNLLYKSKGVFSQMNQTSECPAWLISTWWRVWELK